MILECIRDVYSYNPNHGVNASIGLTRGACYEVVSMRLDNDHELDLTYESFTMCCHNQYSCIQVFNDRGDLDWFSLDIFEIPLSQIREDKLNKILDGSKV